MNPLAFQVGTLDIVRLAYSEVACFLPSSPCNHVFTIEEDTCMTGYGLGKYGFSVADCKEIDVSLFEGILRPFLENLEPIVMAGQTSLLQIQPLISMNSQEQKRLYRTITYEVENLFPEESCNISPPDNSMDNIAGGYTFHPATSVPKWYKKQLMGDEWCHRNMSQHLVAVTMKNTFGKKVVLKLYVDEMKDLKQVAVDLLTSDGKAKQYKTLEKCFSINDQVKKAIRSQLLPMLDTIIMSAKDHFQSCSGESRSDNTSIEQSNSEQLFEKATPVPPGQYPTPQSESKMNMVSNKKHAITSWLHDDLKNCHAPKLDPLLDPNCFKRARVEHVGKPSTATGRPFKYIRKTTDEKNSVAQTYDVMMKMAGKMSTNDHGESGFSSAQMSRFSSFNQARRVMQKEKQLSMEIEAERFRTEGVRDEDDDTDEDEM